MVEVREGDVVDIGREGAEALLVGHGLAGQRHAHVRAAVEAARERDDAGPPVKARATLTAFSTASAPVGSQHRLGGAGDRARSR